MTAPKNFFLCGRNKVDEGAITASVAAVSSMPLSNLQRSSRARVWRSSSAAAVDLIVSLAGTTSERINFVCLSRHNLEPAATWRVQLYTSNDASGAAVYDSGTVAAVDSATFGALDFGVAPLGSGIFDAFLGQKFSVAYFMENTATVINSLRVTITDPGNSAGYVEASRLYAGRGDEFLINWKSLKVKWNEDTKQDRTDGGTLMSDGSLAFREIEAEMEWIDSTQRPSLLDVARFAGMRKDLFIAAVPGVGGESERDHTMIGRFSAMPELGTLFVDTWSSTLKFAEV